jgi:hypothetical protein
MENDNEKEKLEELEKKRKAAAEALIALKKDKGQKNSYITGGQKGSGNYGSTHGMTKQKNTRQKHG